MMSSTVATQNKRWNHLLAKGKQRVPVPNKKPAVLHIVESGKSFVGNGENIKSYFKYKRSIAIWETDTS
jgi:hypothetical protein